MAEWDEYPIHQVPAPLRLVETTDPRAYERYWFSAQDRGGAFGLMTGIGFYPNLGTVDAFVAFNHEHNHTTVRAHRHLRDSRSDMSCGPFQFEVVEPFREWRLRLNECGHNMTFDIRFRDTKRALFQNFRMPLGTDRQPTRTCGYETFGFIHGVIEIDGKLFKLAPQQTCGTRDHHWGERDGVGGLGFKVGHRSTHFGQYVEFKDWGFWGNRVLFNLGDSRSPIMLANAEYELEFDPTTNHFIGGEVTNHLTNGEVRKISYRQIDDKVMYLRTGLYSGPDHRGSPDENYHHGANLGDGVTNRVTYDLTDPKSRIHIAGFDAHFVHATCAGEETVGIMEVKNPVPFEWAIDGKNGCRLSTREKARLKK